MDDFISRKAAKEAAWEGFINNLVEDQGMYGYLVHLVDEVFDAIPAADVRPVVRGKWIVSRTDYGWNCSEFPTHCKCTECGREVPYQDKDNFCPNCGADMRGES